MHCGTNKIEHDSVGTRFNSQTHTHAVFKTPYTYRDMESGRLKCFSGAMLNDEPHTSQFFCAGTRLFGSLCFFFHFSLSVYYFRSLSLAAHFPYRVKYVEMKQNKRGYPTVRRSVCGYVNEKTKHWKENSHSLERTLTLATCWMLFAFRHSLSLVPSPLPPPPPPLPLPE